MDFVHLHVHSAFSFRESLLRVEDIVRAAKVCEMSAVAITDTNAMYGALSFYRLARAEGLAPILGMQVSLAVDEEEVVPGRAAESLDTVVVLAMGLSGYRRLTRLATSARWKRPVPHVTLRELAEYSDGLVVLCGGPESRLFDALARGEVEAAERRLLQVANAVPAGQLFVEVQDHGLRREREGLPSLMELARRYDLPLVATQDVRYLAREDAPWHRAYAQLARADAAERFATDEFHFATKAEMEDRFANLPEALGRTAEIAEMCALDLPLHQVRMPRYATKDGRPAEEVLREAARAGATRRYGAIAPEVEERLERELDVICRMGYADYFLVVADFIRYAHQQGISTGPGRGSAAGSLVAYALRITDVDPIRHKLLFERFLNPARVSLPDIDTDFEFERRGEVIRYVMEKYGRDRVAQIGTFGTLQARAALRDAGRMTGADPALADRLAKLVPGVVHASLDGAYQESAAFRELVDGSPDARRLFEAAKRIEDLPHHTSIHAAGVIISPEPIADWIPLDLAADDTPVTAYPMEDVEALGFVKMDFLGLKTLTLIDRCLESIRKRTGASIDWRQVDEGDKATYALLTRADTNGVFQLESAGMRRVLRELRPTSLDDVIAVISLNRPGPMENIPAFCDAKHGRRPVTYPHPDLEPILADTYGVIVYQEQIMQIASRMAGFSLAEADLLRRAVSKKKREILDEERARFVDGCVRRGYSEETAREVYDLIVRFADYGFNRSHAAAYAVLAFRTAYLRAHFLPDFLAALLTLSMGSPDKIRLYEQDARRHGIQVRPPSVLRSERGYTVEKDGSLRAGLISIRHVGEAAVDHILSLRSEKPFTSLVDFLRRIEPRIVNRKALDSLFAAGALDEFFPENASRDVRRQMYEEALSRAEESRQWAALDLFVEAEAQCASEGPGNARAPSAKRLYIRYRSRGGAQVLREIQRLLAMSPGETEVALYDASTGRARLLGPRYRVEVTQDLVAALEERVGLGNVRLK
ncbi:DNA polymerase III, alpha subunit [Alicyclobacillus acidocaldarius subsp. acidocaldarius Tc-4-1]|uniref:DNA-directed DNA polymerase n=1 Tax=Alicyclobacillus acidocaldarius (strain Tc-4-1) TaxID=1048834 RepID=F8II55_ALIAT|nr:DNA polymerase III, alpha subunit [Alicyclobacillus acidocaldarius subsp. acidocaldarius Tc-4-1]